MRIFSSFLERIQDFNTGAGIITNLLLLFVIKRFSSVELGTYKYLLTVFSLNDICLTLLHMVLRPKNIIMGTVFSLVADGPVQSKHFASIYSAGFTIPFSLMCYHFIYRYWAIKSPYRLELFTNVRFVGGIVAHIRNDEFQVRPAIVVLILDTVSSIQIVFSLVLAYKTFSTIKENSTISSYARRFHVQVLITLCAQTIIPLVFVFLPYFCSITFPLVKLSFAILSPICIPLISFFPSWDALIVVCLIKDYRVGVKELFKPFTSLFTTNSTKVIRIDSIGQATSKVAPASESGISSASKSRF